MEAIALDDDDRELFLKTLGEASISSGWKVHGFVLMGNHYHLLIETRRPTLVKGMQYLNSTYTRRYNIRHKTYGHLFQGRYKALLVDGEAKGYFLTVSDYIHMNPIRAGRAKSLDDLLRDKWSSVGWIAGIRKGPPEWLGCERVYGELGLGGVNGRARREYREYLRRRIQELGKDEEGWKKIRRGWCLGGEEFVGEMKARLAELSRKPRDSESWNDPVMEELEEERALKFLCDASKRLGYASPERVRGQDRLILAAWIRQQTKVSVKWIACQLGIKTRGGMSSGIYKIKQLLPENRSLLKRWKLLGKS